MTKLPHPGPRDGAERRLSEVQAHVVQANSDLHNSENLQHAGGPFKAAWQRGKGEGTTESGQDDRGYKQREPEDPHVEDAHVKDCEQPLADWHEYRQLFPSRRTMRCPRP